MNKIKSIYPTELPSSVEDNPIKQTFTNFKNRLDLKIQQTVAARKNLILTQKSLCTKQLIKIREQANKHRRRVFQQQQQFQDRVQNQIKYDINKWNDYQMYFKNSFDRLEKTLQIHRNNNEKHHRNIDLKRKEIKELYNDQRQSHSRLISLIQKGDKNTKQTTKQTSILSYSHSTKRIKTQSSLPTLKPSPISYQRIKTIQSDCDESPQLHPKKALSYMQATGTLRQNQQSSFRMLIDMLKWYKGQEEGKIGDNWFLKVVFNHRNFNRLIFYMESHYGVRRVNKKL